MSISAEIRFQSSFGDLRGETEVKQILGVPAAMKAAFDICMGHPVPQTRKYLRVRRDAGRMAHHNS
jgi:hypothetical protein